jgi:hypothetical protein
MFFAIKSIGFKYLSDLFAPDLLSGVSNKSGLRPPSKKNQRHFESVQKSRVYFIWACPSSVFGCTHTDEGRAIRSSPSGSDALALGRPLLSLTQKTSENKVIGHCPLFMNRFAISFLNLVNYSLCQILVNILIRLPWKYKRVSDERPHLHQI